MAQSKEVKGSRDDKQSNKPNRGNRGRKQPRKDSRSKRVNYDNTREDKYIKDISETRRSNDVAWYAKNPELLRSASSIPFAATTGMKFPWLDKTTTISRNASVPGVFAAYWNPSIGGQYLDPVNQAKNSIYSYTVHANSRNRSYSAEDEMLLILAGASLFSMLATGIRAYGTMRIYDQRNKYLPQALVQAMGFDFNDLKSNLAQMWFDLNELISRSSQIWIPNTLPIIERWWWMNSSVYMDANSVKAQYYVFSPSSYLLYDETGSEQGGQLLYKSTKFMYGNVKWSEYMTRMNSMFDALLNSEDRGIIFGDILKAYGAESIYAVKPIESSYQVVPVYDMEVLTQIENATAIYMCPQSIQQDVNTQRLVVEYPVRTGSTNYKQILPSSTILNVHDEAYTDPAHVMVATRLMALGSLGIPKSSSDSSLAYIIPRTCGTETIEQFRIYYYTNSGTIGSNEFQTSAPSVMLSSTDDVGVAMANAFQVLSRWSAFDWAPWMYSVLGVSSFTYGSSSATSLVDNQFVPEFTFGDFDIWTTIDVETLQKMHLSALYSEFGVPAI